MIPYKYKDVVALLLVSCLSIETLAEVSPREERFLFTFEALAEPLISGKDVLKSRPRLGRLLLSRLELSEEIAKKTDKVTAPMIRSASEKQWLISDALGGGLQRKIHFYFADRINEIIAWLSSDNPWRPGTYVATDEGPGLIVGQGQVQGSRTARPVLIELFKDKRRIELPIKKLRHLYSANELAERFGIPRHRLDEEAPRRGIEFDHAGEKPNKWIYFDGKRLPELRRKTRGKVPLDSWPTGMVVINSSGRVAEVRDYHRATDRLELKVYPGGPLLRNESSSQWRSLVTERELARRENMSRYRLVRILREEHIDPQYQETGGLNRILYDFEATHPLILNRLAREAAAIPLRTLARRAQLPLEVLFRKVQKGLVKSLQVLSFLVEQEEADRVIRLGLRMKDPNKNLSGLGLVQFARRGHHGLEVLHWDIPRLLDQARNAVEDERNLLWEQVIWIAEGQKTDRFSPALIAYAGHQKDLSLRQRLVQLDLLLPVIRSLKRLHALPVGRRLATQLRRQMAADLLGRFNEANFFLSGGHKPIAVKGGETFINELLSGEIPLNSQPVAPEDMYAAGTVVVIAAEPEAGPAVIVSAESSTHRQRRVVLRFFGTTRVMNVHTSLDRESRTALLYTVVPAAEMVRFRRVLNALERQPQTRPWEFHRLNSSSSA